MLKKIKQSHSLSDYERPLAHVVDLEPHGVLCGSTRALIEASSFSLDDENDIEF